MLDQIFWIALFGGLAIALLVESIRPRYVWTPRARIAHGLRNLSIWLIATALIAIVAAQPFAQFSAYLVQQRIGLLPALNVPFWAAAVIGFLVADFADYALHCASHALKPLWLLHCVHHSDKRLDATTTLRQHPLAVVVGLVVRALLLIALGAPLEALLVRDVLAMTNSHFHHAAIAWSPRSTAWIERYLSWLLVPPTAHWLHHDPAEQFTNSNYGGLLSCWDRLIGTYVPGTKHTATSGLSALNAYAWQTVPGMLTTPWRARKKTSL